MYGKDKILVCSFMWWNKKVIGELCISVKDLEGIVNQELTFAVDRVSIQCLDGLLQDFSICSALALEILQSCTKPSKLWWYGIQDSLQCPDIEDCEFVYWCISCPCDSAATFMTHPTFPSSSSVWDVELLIYFPSRFPTVCTRIIRLLLLFIWSLFT